jgi:hypothetical protein
MRAENSCKPAGEGASSDDAFKEALDSSIQDLYAACDEMVTSRVLR